jgi:exoribonuclease-2
VAELRQNQILFVAKDGTLSPMVVVSLEGNRVKALDAQGEEHWLAVKRVFWITEHEVDTPHKLPAYWHTVVHLSEGIDLPDLWTSLSESERNAPLSLPELLVKLDLASQVSGADAFVLAVFGHSLHFKIRQQQLLISNPEQVQVALEKAADKERERKAFEEAKSWLLMALDGQNAGDQTPTVDDHLEAIKAVALFGRDASLSRKGMELLNAVLDDDPRDPATVAFEVLCTLGIYASNENLIPHRADLKRTFPKNVQKELQKGDVQSTSLARRHDMTHLRTLSIDDMQTREIDDAFALEGNRLHVFIADVSHFIPIGSQLDQEAAKRLSTVYIPEGKIPMLPSIIGEELASLNQSEIRPALCFSGTIDDQGGFSDVELREVLCGRPSIGLFNRRHVASYRRRRG